MSGRTVVNAVDRRIVSGFSIGGLSVMVPMYQGESSPSHIRGAIVCCYQLFITIGILLANLVNFGTEGIENTGSWRIVLGLGFLFPIILAVGILFFPETPRFNFRHGKIDRARRDIARFYGVSENHRVVNETIDDCAKKLREEEAGAEGRKWSDVFTGPRMRYRILLGMAIQMFQQLSKYTLFIPSNLLYSV